MALKPDRHVVVDEISYFLNETATRGKVLSFSTFGSGAAMDQSVALLTVAANGSGAFPAGLLLGDMVNYDLTRQHLNQHKDEIQVGSKVCILMNGWAVTDQIKPGITPAVGDLAYLGPTGYITNAATILSSVTFTGAPTTNAPLIGQFMSIKDSDGFAKVYINLPQGRVV